MTLPTIRPIGMSVLVLDLNATTPDKRSSKLFSQLSDYLVHLSPPGLLNFHMWDDVGHWLYWQASTHFSILFTLLDNSVPHQVLAGVFLFASTTARSSPALLGWNCAYALFSNVSESDPPFCLLTGKSVDDIRRALCNHFRSLPSQPPRHGKWAHRNRDSHFLASSFVFSRAISLHTFT